MKNKIYTTIAILSFCGSAFMTSCDDLLDTKSPSSLENSVIFSDPDLAEGAIKGIYTYYGEQNYRARYLPWYGMNTDIEWYNSSEKGDDKAHLVTFNALPNNTQMNIAESKEPWSNIYNGIEKANLAIQGLKASADLTNSKLKQLYGEALTLRAMAYVDLINAWGDVPSRFEPVTTPTIYMARTDKYQIYKQLIKDLQEAENLVAWPNESTITQTAERINKAFVKGLLARVCLQASGYSLTANGTSEKSNDPELDKSVLYPIALQACKDVMDQEGVYVALKDKFEDIFQDICRDVISAGSESLWEIPYANAPSARGRMVYTFGLKHNTTDDMTDVAQGGQAGPTPFFFFDYSVKDKRRDISCIPYKWDKGVQGVNSLNTWYFGKLRYEWMERKASGNDDGINKQYMRYADIVLMRAELENELNGAAAAAPYLKQIRQRAFDQADWSTEVDQYVSNVSGDKTAMFNAIVDERAFEFCGEFIRRADLIRWNLLKVKLDEAKEKMYRLRTLAGEYADLSGRLFYKNVDYKWTRGGTTRTIVGGGLELFGLNHGELAENVPTGFTEYTDSKGAATLWIKEDNLKDDKIETIYVQNPDKFMYWPIFQYNLDANILLENYSWYGN
ncbi:hypothetical protein GGR06_002968 [Bacteroides reticulotermitis]|nr:RagB/SusD family nutrient uptake outer membrane protein [Bacteroides reticulotermitis]MBB4045158.1 hypothetical protein [Bacteroides reticulotermitis]